jgi:hypothetical protein
MLSATGAVSCSGNARYGQLGEGTFGASLVPTAIK